MKLKGIIGYPVTSFSDDNTINLPVLKQMLNLLIENGCDAIAPLGSTGESAYLEWDEWCLVAKLEDYNRYKTEVHLLIVHKFYACAEYRRCFLLPS